MKLIEISENSAKILFSKDELRVLRGSTGEPLYGFNCDICKLTGWEREEAIDLNNGVKVACLEADEQGGQTTCSLDKKEIEFFIKVIVETLNELDREYQTRTGAFPEEAIAVRDELQEILSNMV